MVQENLLPVYALAVNFTDQTGRAAHILLKSRVIKGDKHLAARETAEHFHGVCQCVTVGQCRSYSTVYISIHAQLSMFSTANHLDRFWFLLCTVRVFNWTIALNRHRHSHKQARRGPIDCTPNGVFLDFRTHIQGTCTVLCMSQFLYRP